VVGIPTGGRTICVAEGVVSRICNLSLSDPGDTVLSIQIDAAVNAGNSGGPVLNSQGKVAGVAFCKSTSTNSDNIGYVIAASVVHQFSGRCHSDGTYSLCPRVPSVWHGLEN
jgi:S1-C subfamily serine protease